MSVSNTSRNAAAYDHLVPQFKVPVRRRKKDKDFILDRQHIQTHVALQISPLTNAEEINLWRKPKLELTGSL